MIAIIVLVLAILAAGLVISGVYLLLGTPYALILAGVLLFGIAARLRILMVPNA